jgi:hypothetical protein
MNYPDGLKSGNLLRIKKQCRNNFIIREHGEYAILIPRLTKDGDKSGLWDVIFPSGYRVAYMPTNWETPDA